MAVIVEDEREVAGKLGLDIIDVYAFSESMETEEHCDDNLHMNEQGHRLVARFIYDQLCRILSD
jgi:lysophospholipase L1-like esterase